MLSILFSGFLVAFFSFCHLNLQGVSPRKINPVYTVDGIPSARTKLHVAEAPPLEISVALGSTVIVKCEIFGDPSPNAITWNKNGQPFVTVPSSGDSVSYKKGVEIGTIAARLVLPCVQLSDGARYTCTATGQDGGTVGADTELYIEAQTANWTSHCGDWNPPPVISLWRPFFIEEFHNDALFYCRTNGKGNVTWVLPDSELSESERMQVLWTGDLLLKNVTWDDLGHYTCRYDDSESITTFFYPAKPKDV